MNRIAAFASLVLAVWSASGTPARAETVFDNSVNWTFSNGVLGGAEWADDVHLTKPGSMTSFRFGYISNGSSQATIRFYSNSASNTPLPAAGAQFFSITVGIPGGGSSGEQTVNLATPVLVPAHMWMSVQFNGSSGSIGLYNPPVVGSSNSNMVVHVSSGTSGNVFGSGKNSFQLAIAIADPEWTNLGHALAGTAGLPKLTASGMLAAGSAYSIDLSSARPSAPAWLVLGTSTANLPTAGGLLVPTPSVILPMATSAAGTIDVDGTTPAGLPPGTTIIAQYWILDRAGVAGYAASNAETATSP